MFEDRNRVGRHLYNLFKDKSCWKCEKNWELHGEKCYHFSTSTSPWEEGRGLCEEEEGHLVKIDSRREQVEHTLHQFMKHWSHERSRHTSLLSIDLSHSWRGDWETSWTRMRTSSGSDWLTPRRRTSGCGWTALHWTPGLIVVNKPFLSTCSVQADSIIEPVLLVLLLLVCLFGTKMSRTIGKIQKVMTRTVWGWERKVELLTWSVGLTSPVEILTGGSVRNEPNRDVGLVSEIPNSFSFQCQIKIQSSFLVSNFFLHSRRDVSRYLLHTLKVQECIYWP